MYVCMYVCHEKGESSFWTDLHKVSFSDAYKTRDDINSVYMAIGSHHTTCVCRKEGRYVERESMMMLDDGMEGR